MFKSVRNAINYAAEVNKSLAGDATLKALLELVEVLEAERNSEEPRISPEIPPIAWDQLMQSKIHALPTEGQQITLNQLASFFQSRSAMNRNEASIWAGNLLSEFDIREKM